jgi:transcriptional regulator with XRE-family HTH domain
MPELVDIREAVAARAAADVAIADGMRAARQAGFTLQQIADAAGVTRQRVYQVLGATGRPAHEAALQARLDVLDARWSKFIDALAPMFTHPDGQREQLSRNQANGLAKRKHVRAHAAAAKRGLASSVGPVLRPTVAVEGRDFAETYALRFVEENASNPVVVKVVRELDEAAAIREKRTTRRDSRVSFLHD